MPKKDDYPIPISEVMKITKVQLYQLETIEQQMDMLIEALQKTEIPMEPVLRQMLKPLHDGLVAINQPKPSATTAAASPQKPTASTSTQPLKK